MYSEKVKRTCKSTKRNVKREKLELQRSVKKAHIEALGMHNVTKNCISQIEIGEVNDDRKAQNKI